MDEPNRGIYCKVTKGDIVKQKINMSENKFTKLKPGTITDIFQTGLSCPLLKFMHLDLFILNFFFKVMSLILIGSFHQINLMK